MLWLAEIGAVGTELVLGPEEAHYVTRVCRARTGDRVGATDGRGALAELRVLPTRDETRVQVETLRHLPAPPPAILACGPPEGDRADWLVEKLAELGVTQFQPLECERAPWERFAKRRARMERLALAGMKQSRRVWRVVLADPLAPSAWIERLPDGPTRWIADAGGETAVIGARPGGNCGAVGPAPGYSALERRSFEAAGFRPVRLADARLRTETAALCLAGTWSAAVDPGTRA